MSTDALKTAFWQVVSDCLVEFHDYSSARARMDVLLLRGRMEESPAGIDPEMIYHSEPFDIACRLAEEEVQLEKHRLRYEEIWSRRVAEIDEDTISVSRPRIQPREASA